MATTALLIAAAAALLVAAVCPAGAFVQLMGNSDIYCDSEGAFCQADDSCCAGLECVPRFSRFGGSGGVCQRRGQQRDLPADRQPQARFSPASHSLSCQTDSECPSGQCCVRRSVGVRGGGVSTCDADCSENEVSNILGDFYSRYYRRSLRAGHGKQQHHKQKPSKDGDHEDKKKNKEKKASA